MRMDIEVSRGIARTITHFCAACSGSPQLVMIFASCQLSAKFWSNAPQGSRPDQSICYKLACSEAWQHTIIFVVDDNLIGNKKAIKPVLREIVRWQQERAYPLTLFTEASLDLAEDEELMELMGLANFQSVFIGIETPNEDSLRETKEAPECAA